MSKSNSLLEELPLWSQRIVTGLGVPVRFLGSDPEPPLPTAEEFVQALQLHPELCDQVRDLLNKRHLRSMAKTCGFGPQHYFRGPLPTPRHYHQHDDQIDALRYMTSGNRMFSEAVGLWADYDVATEVYDRTVCSGVSPHTGDAMPTNGHERMLISQYAKAQWSKLRQKAAASGITAEVLQAAKKSMAREQLYRERMGRISRTSP